MFGKGKKSGTSKNLENEEITENEKITENAEIMEIGITENDEKYEKYGKCKKIENHTEKRKQNTTTVYTHTPSHTRRIIFL